MVKNKQKVLDYFSKCCDNSKAIQTALRMAKWAAKLGEVPVGVVIINNENKIIAVAQNRVERNKDVIAHAEIIAIRRATNKLKTKYLDKYCLVTTLEPCSMCASAIREARIPLLIYGAQDKKGGAINNTCKLYSSQSVRPSPIVISSVMEEECGQILKSFFQKLRLAM